jgi:hypothetical protein
LTFHPIYYNFLSVIEQKTVLVLGAGASVPFGFPTGQGLKARICSGSADVNTNLNRLQELGFDRDNIEMFRVALMKSGRSSVDAFLEYREDFLSIGKAAIASTLLRLEKTDAIFGGHIEGNWYDYLFGILSDGTSFDELDKNKLSIITFNYDRSFEHYLFIALKNSYKKSNEECAEKLSKIPIIHVHGKLGDLEWQTSATGEPPVPYDSNAESGHILSAAKNMKIIPENKVDTEEFIHARKLILGAQLLFFLGFGYHPMNLRRLGMEYMEKKQPVTVQGTCLGLSKERDDKVKRLYPFLREISLIEKDVYTFLYNYVILSPA